MTNFIGNQGTLERFFKRKLSATGDNENNDEDTSTWIVTKYGCLEYSENVDMCFCLYCYLFWDCNKGQGGNDAFVVDG